MSTTSIFYLARAEECAREAEQAVLANVRERAQRSEAAWRSMAGQVQRSEAMRDKQAAEKAEQLEA